MLTPEEQNLINAWSDANQAVELAHQELDNAKQRLKKTKLGLITGLLPAGHDYGDIFDFKTKDKGVVQVLCMGNAGYDVEWLTKPA